MKELAPHYKIPSKDTKKIRREIWYDSSNDSSFKQKLDEALYVI